MVSATTSTSFDSSDDSSFEESLNSRYAKKREAAKRRKLQLQQRRLAKKGKIPNAVPIEEMTSSSSEVESPSEEPEESLSIGKMTSSSELDSPTLTPSDQPQEFPVLVQDQVELKETSETSSVNLDSSEVIQSTESIPARKSITRRLGNIFNRVHSFIGNLKKIKTPVSQILISEISVVEKSNFDEPKSLQEADELQKVRSQSAGLQERSDELEVEKESTNGSLAMENREKLEEGVTDETPEETSTQEVNKKKLTLQEYLEGLNGNGNNLETMISDLELVGDEQIEEVQNQKIPTTSEHVPVVQRVRTFKELNQVFQLREF